MRKKFKSYHRSKRMPPGSIPGSFVIAEDAPVPKITVFSYNKELLEESHVSSFAEIKNQIEKHPSLNHWIDIKGFGDVQLLEYLREYFGIHKLILSDIVHVYQRPKIEEYEKHYFIISRMLYLNGDNMLMNKQVSIILGSNYIISFQEQYKDVLDSMRERLRQGKGYIRISNVDFVAYSIIDALLDHFFPLLENTGDRLDELEEHLFSAIPRQTDLQQIQQIKKELNILRRSVWSERDKINDLLRSDLPLISKNTKLYLRDTYDHCIQVMDIVDNYKELTSSLMDVYISGVNNRMNHVMKVLTVISTIFIPLTFIVGVYGMNFSYQDPVTGKPFSFNMPELYSPYGYVGVLLFMAAVVGVQLYIFYKKGWLRKE